MERGETTDSYYWKHSCPVFVDAVEYTARIETDTRATRKRLAEQFSQLRDLIICNEGRVIDTAGDGIFAEFASVKNALECLTKFLVEVAAGNRDEPLKRRIRFRCGVASGQVLQEDHLISGITVNVAARLQQLAEPGTINLDGEAQREIRGDNNFSFIDQGFRLLKGISNPVRVWRVADEDHSDLVASERLARSYRDDIDDPSSADQRRASDWISSARAIAILPFEMPPQDVEHGDGEERYMALGLAADIAQCLSRSKWLKVISPRSSLNYSDAKYNDNEIAKELGVRYLLKGRMLRTGALYKITTNLVDCPTGTIVWSHKYERNAETVLETLDQIAEQIASTIEPEYLRQESQRAAAGHSRNLTTWDLIMRGRWHFWRGSKKHVMQAIVCAENALQLEPENPRALSLLSFCQMTLVWTARAPDPKSAIQLAVEYARRAVTSDDLDATAHFTLGSAISQTGDLSRAIAAERRALELTPNFASAMGELARMETFSGNSEEGRRLALNAIDFSPSDPHISLFVRTLAFASFIEGDLDAAVELAQEAIAKRPDWFFHHVTLAGFEGLRGNKEAARLALSESRRLVPAYPRAELIAGHPFAEKKFETSFLKGLKMAGWDETG